MNRLYALFKPIGKYLASWSQEQKLFALSLTCLGILFYIPNNKLLFLATCLYVAGFYFLYKKITLALLYVYILLLPFQNGRGIGFLVVPADLVYGNIPFTITVNYTMSNIILTVLLYIYIRTRIINRHARGGLPIRIPDIFLCIFFVTNIIASIYSNIPLLSALLTLQLISYAVPYYFIRQERLKTWLTGALLPVFTSLGIFEGFWTILQFFNNGTLGKSIEVAVDQSLSGGLAHVASEDFTYARMQGTFTHPNSLGFFMAMVAPVLLYYSVSRSVSRFGKIISAISFFLVFIALILSGSRASWICFVIAILILWKTPAIHLSLEVLSVIKRFYRFVFLLCIAVAPVIIVPRLQQFVLTFGPDGGAQFRWVLIKKTLTMVASYPLGVGMGVYPNVLFGEFGGSTSSPTQPHNLIAQVAAASGILGAVSFCALLFLLLRSVINTIRKNGRKKPLYCVYAVSLGIFLMLSMAYPVLTEQQIFAWMFILLAVLV
jgi:hypothetical protein